MSNNSTKKGIAVVVNMATTSLPQLAALVSMTATEFGMFSVSYLSFAFATSLLLSITCEPWVRATQGASQCEEGYFSTSVCIGGLLGLIGGVLFYASSESVLKAVLSAAAVMFSSVWYSVRFKSAFEDRWTVVVIGDTLGVVGFVSAFLVGGVLNAGVVGVFAAWILSGSLPMLCWILTKPRVSGSPLRWLRHQRKSIVALLPESLILDAGAIGTPLLLYPLMGPSNFGAYRAISNCAFPIRLVLGAIRPILARNPTLIITRFRVHVVVILLSVLMGGIVAVAIIRFGELLPNSVLGALRGYWLYAGLFTAVTGLGQLYYFACRLGCRARYLLLGRMVQTVLVVLCPFIGWFTSGIHGAIIGFTVSAILAAAAWFTIARQSVVAAERTGD